MGQGHGPSHWEDAETGTVIDVQAIDDEAGTATLRVTRALTRITGTTSGVAPFTTTLTAAGPGTLTWDDGSTGASVRRTFGVGTHTVSVTASGGGTATKQIT